MSFAELTYPLLQGWDWWHMYRTQDIQIQVGGSDQYGNIVAGIDAIKHIAQNPEYDTWARLYDTNGKIREDMAPVGITTPLLTTSGGEKFGKSAGNAVWLDAKLTSPFDLYGVSRKEWMATLFKKLVLLTLFSFSSAHPMPMSSATSSFSPSSLSRRLVRS